MISQDLESLLRKSIELSHVEVRDDSLKHRGHAGASGGGHFGVVLVSDAFEGKSLLERHREVYDAVDMGRNGEIHALSIEAFTPVEWKERKR